MNKDLTDITIRIRGLRTEAEAVEQWPAILGRLGRVRDGIRRRRPEHRRSAAADVAADWCYREIRDAPATEAMRADALEVLADIQAVGGPRRASPARP
jgi:hypothetical protein